MKKSLIIHPFLFAIYPILFLYSNNIRCVLIKQLILPIIIIIFFTFLLFSLLSFIFKNKKKAGLVTSFFIVLLFLYGHIYHYIEGFTLRGFEIGRHRHLLFVWAILFTSSFYFSMKTRKNLLKFTNLLNTIAFLLVLISLINIAAFMLKPKTSDIWQDMIKMEDRQTNTKELKKVETLPDIYYIVLDRYASASTLKEFYDFDNSKFIAYLSNKGFYVATESSCNYPKTDHSLASSLNMEYINYLSKSIKEKSKDRTLLYAIIQDNKVCRFLKSKGYKYIHFGSRVYPTNQNKYADINYNLYPLSEFPMRLYQTTMFYPICIKLGIPGIRLLQWKRILYKFEKLSEVPNIKGPAFIFAHMLIPHDPYIFDRNGNFLEGGESYNKKSRKTKYVDQLIFTNRKLKMLIDKLLSSSEIPPIIIVQSDEGPFPQRSITDGLGFSQLTRAELREKMRILNAYYLPNVDKGVLYPSITPVNTFRLIFNHYFDTNYELLPDENFIFPNLSIYTFFKVTDKIK